MLRKFSVSNYRGFKDEIIFDLTRVKGYAFNDFAIKNNLIKCGIIYGKNGSGKTNLGYAIFDLIFHLVSSNKRREATSNYLNGFNNFEVATFTYEFLINDQIFKYSYQKSDPYTLKYEELFINNALVFSYNFCHKKGDFSGLGLVNVEAINSNIEMNLSVFRYIIHNKNISGDNPLNLLMDFINRMLWLQTTDDHKEDFLVSQGTNAAIDILMIDDNLAKFESFLAANDVNLKLSLEKDLTNENMLFVNFDNARYPFHLVASHGTSVLLLYFYWFTIIEKASFVFIDEFDACFHNEVAERILKNLFAKKTNQIFMTTQRTTIMSNDLLRPDCYFIIANNKISSLSDITERELREGHNLEKLYQGGAFSV